MFTSFLFEEHVGLVDVAGHTLCALGDAEHALTLTTPEDIGMLTAMIFFHSPTIENEIVYIAGDTITYQQLANLLSQHYGVNFSLRVYDLPHLQAAVERSPRDNSAAYRLAFARRNGVAWSKSATYNARNKIAVTDVKQWLLENRLTG